MEFHRAGASQAVYDNVNTPQETMELSVGIRSLGNKQCDVEMCQTKRDDGHQTGRWRYFVAQLLITLLLVGLVVPIYVMHFRGSTNEKSLKSGLENLTEVFLLQEEDHIAWGEKIALNQEEQRQRLITELDKKYEDLVQQMEMRDKEINETVKRAVFKMKKENLQAAGWYLASNGLAYKYKSEKKTFNDAEEDCNRNCASLAASGIWNNSARQEIKEENIFGSNPTYTWIGLHYNRSEGNWTWNYGTGEEIPWAQGEPNDGNRLQRACAHIWAGKNKRNIVLADTECDAKFAFLCEREIDSDLLCPEQ